MFEGGLVYIETVSWVILTWDSLPREQTDVTENINFLQLPWRMVKIITGTGGFRRIVIIGPFLGKPVSK